MDVAAPWGLAPSAGLLPAHGRLTPGIRGNGELHAPTPNDQSVGNFAAEGQGQRPGLGAWSRGAPLQSPTLVLPSGRLGRGSAVACLHVSLLDKVGSVLLFAIASIPTPTVSRHGPACPDHGCDRRAGANFRSS
ncbi:hypothetical protein BKA81DRAFT_395751 [Phyllosticta paracitricarpa]